MLSQNKIKYLTSLQSKKFRQKYNIFLAEGDKIGIEIIKDKKIIIENIFALPSWVAQNEAQLTHYKDKLIVVDEADLKKISSLTTPNRVVVAAQIPDFQLDNDVFEKDIVLYLDGIQDPGNMGTILRNADWFGIRYVFCADNCVDIYNAKVIQASMGAFLRVKSTEISLSELLENTADMPVYGAVLEGENLFKMSLDKKGIIVIGSEGKGISEENLSLLTKKIKIPAFGEGAESLNAAVATGIICAAFRN